MVCILDEASKSYKQIDNGDKERKLIACMSIRLGKWFIWD